MAEKTAGPCWGYKIENGEVISKLFKEGGRPRGWKDTPAGMQEAIVAEAEAEEQRIREEAAKKAAEEEAARAAEEAAKKADKKGAAD